MTTTDQTHNYYMPEFKDASSTTSADNLTARKLLEDRVPSLLGTGQSTKSISIHRDLEFRGTLKHWSDFEKEVRDLYEQQFPADARRQHILGFKPKNNTEGLNNIYNETVYVGDEDYLRGRFVQQVLVPVTVTLQDLRQRVRYGDSKSSQCREANKKLPDSVASVIVEETDDNDKLVKFVRPRVVGEAKVFWTHPLSLWMQEDNGLEFANLFRKLLGKTSLLNSNCAPPILISSAGQIADYLRVNNLTYGYVTTYNETVFVKQAKALVGQNTKWVLYYSNPIRHDTTYIDNPTANDNPRGPPDPETGALGRRLRWNPYLGCVTFRQCMFYITYQSMQGNNYEAKLSREEAKKVWVLKGTAENPIPKTPKTRAENIDDRAFNR
jgi:hypothetical protein